MDKIVGWIPIRPHLLRYVAWRENLTTTEPPTLIIPGFTPIRQGFELCMTNKSNFIAAQMRREESRVGLEYTERLHYQVSGSRFAKNYFHVTTPMALAFNMYLHYMLHDDLRQRVIAGQEQNRLEVETIDAFIDELDIFELVDRDAIKKAQYRLRRAMGYDMKPGRKGRGLTHFRRNLLAIAL